MVILVGIFFVLFFVLFLRKEYPDIFKGSFWQSLFAKNDRAAVFQKTLSFKIRFLFFIAFTLVTAFGVYMSWQYYRYITRPVQSEQVVIDDVSVLQFSNQLFSMLLPIKRDDGKYFRDLFDTHVMGITSKSIYTYLAEKEGVSSDVQFFSKDAVMSLTKKNSSEAVVSVVFYLCAYPEDKKIKPLHEKYEVLMRIVLTPQKNMPFNSTVRVREEYALSEIEFKKIN